MKIVLIERTSSVRSPTRLLIPTPPMRPRVRVLLIAAVASAALACGGDPSSPAPAWVGVYQLRTVHGAALPVTIDPVGIQVKGGAITLRRDGSYMRTWETQQTYGPGSTPTALPTLRCSGRYEVAAEMANMTETSGTSGCASYPAGLRPDTIFFVSDTLFGVYVR